MDTDRSGRTLKAYRDLFWKAEQRIKELQASLKAGGEVSERQYQRIKELQAKLDAVKEVESYSIEFPAFGRPATVMLTKDVLAAIGEQSDE